MKATPDFRKWDIWLAEVQFEDIPDSKKRPVLILENLVLVIDCLKMTSKAPRPGEYALKMWREAGLHKSTTVRISKRLELEPKAMLKRIGALHPVDILEVQKRMQDTNP